VDVVEAIERERVVAVIRRAADVGATVERLGLPLVEVTMDSPGALESIARLREDTALTVLAGTVRTADEASAAIGAGAQAVVAPTTVAEVAAACRALGVPWIPGALTPTEIEAAWRAGAALVKLFPASLGGPAYVRAVLAPLGGVRLLATGGVDAANASAFLEAGAVAVGADSSRARAVYDAVKLND
jgi:2-dehydro-3-deoxyphosphogluconate aldolase/(4S)-4-hydroxy-2-oxoglutarate aldolase